jgi:hypothetical protein
LPDVRLPDPIAKSKEGKSRPEDRILLDVPHALPVAVVARAAEFYPGHRAIGLMPHHEIVQMHLRVSGVLPGPGPRLLHEDVVESNFGEDAEIQVLGDRREGAVEGVLGSREEIKLRGQLWALSQRWILTTFVGL